MSGVERTSLMNAYLTSAVEYLKYQFPNKSEEDLVSFVKNIINTKLRRPTAKILDYPSFGNIELRENVDLLNFVRKYSNKFIAPFGTVFETTDVKVPNIKLYLDYLVAQRDKSKHHMFELLAVGKTAEAELANFDQGLRKIKANSVSGACQTPVNAMYDSESYNSITSTCRYATMLAYSFAERFLASNYYFPTEEVAMNFIITTIRHCPSKEVIDNLVKKYNLYEPWYDDIEDLVYNGIAPYKQIDKRWMRDLKEMLINIPRYKLTFLYYCRNFYNLLAKNLHFWKPWIEKFFYMDDIVIDEKIVPEDVFKIEGDLLVMMTIRYTDVVKGMKFSDFPTLKPEEAKKFAAIGLKMQEMIDDIKDMTDTFLHADNLVSHLHLQKRMMRKAIVVSDTDSIIYTTKVIMEAYLGTTFTYKHKDIYNVHALITYYLSKSVASLLGHMAVCRGIIGKQNIKMIKMKNEFLFDSIVSTTRAKHYATPITIREGVVLDKPKFDIKGVGFRTSNVPKVTQNFTTSILKKLTEDLKNHENVYASDYIMESLDYEKTIKASLKKGEFDYVGNVSIKKKDEYKDAYKSIYFNYEVWEHVFADTYEHINLPTKCYLIPFTKKIIRSERYLAWLNTKSPKVYDRLIAYLNTIDPKKEISRIPVPQSIKRIPKELIPLIDYRRIIYANMAPSQLALRSICIDLGDMKKRPLLSDIYVDGTLEE